MMRINIGTEKIERRASNKLYVSVASPHTVAGLDFVLPLW
jgi:hypothetical protein